MTARQWFFDTAVRGLASQSFERSVGDGGRCSYRGKNGRKCAVGYLIPDREYHREMEYHNAHETLRDHPRLRRYRKWLTRLQGAHDAADSPGDMVQRLYAFASHERLDPEVLNSLGMVFNP